MSDKIILKDIHCQNKKCRAVLCRTDGVKLYWEDDKPNSKLFTRKKKRHQLLYCLGCNRYSTRFDGEKFKRWENKIFDSKFKNEISSKLLTSKKT